jgi:outer membrane PBP1 activator LpoA protein
MKRFLPLLLLVSLAGCASVGEVARMPPEVNAADQMLASGHAREAAKAYETQAATANGPLRDMLEERAANAWQQAGDHQAARRDFASVVDPKHLNGDDGLRFRLLRGEFTIADGRPAQALGDLNIADEAIPQALGVRWYRAHAAALEASGDKFDAAAEYAMLESMQSKHDENATRARIHTLLTSLDDATLARGAAALPLGHPLYAAAGHMLTARGLPLPHPYARAASALSESTRPPADEDGYRPPLKLALLLPASGPVAVAASAVRDGFMTAYYAESRRRPEIHVYDTADSAGGAVAAYKKAVADGNDFVVGPLGREQVSALFGQSDVSVPILALNRAATPAPPGSQSFSLAPEDEGVAAAERLLSRKLLHAIAFTARDDNAVRALAAFREAYTQRGGSIVAEAVIADAGPNYGPILHDALTKAGDQYDAIFLALKAPAARLLATQLPTNGYRDVPRESTSLILSGGGNARLDQELDGIEYPELAWLLHSINGLPDAASLGSHLPSARGGGARLFAFGADAFRLSAYLESLTASPEASVRGATGALHLDGVGNVQRDSEWAVFSGGRGRPAQDGGLQTEPVSPGAPRSGL